MIDNNHIFSVTEINSLIKDIFDNTPFFKSLRIKGEISNWKRTSSGHIYFSIKDNDSNLRCVLFRYDASFLKQDFKDGDFVVLTGSITSYVSQGTYQFYVKKIEFEGEGDLLLKRKLLIDKLNKEHLFDEDHKKEFIKYPMKIGVIVGKNSAAEKDILFNLNRRWPISEINFHYSLVQGKEAKNDLIYNLEQADKMNYDCIILARGGGSKEDLSIFDDEDVVRTVYKINTPIVTAIGHEIDLSICDLVSDKHVSTPTGACEAVVPDINDVLNYLDGEKEYLSNLLSDKIESFLIKLDSFKNHKALHNISHLYDGYEQKIDILKDRLNEKMSYFIEDLETKLNNQEIILDKLNPKNILNKGYTIIKNDEDKVIYNSTLLEEDQKATIIFNDKEVEVTIKKR